MPGQPVLPVMRALPGRRVRNRVALPSHTGHRLRHRSVRPRTDRSHTGRQTLRARGAPGAAGLPAVSVLRARAVPAALQVWVQPEQAGTTRESPLESAAPRAPGQRQPLILKRVLQGCPEQRLLPRVPRPVAPEEQGQQTRERERPAQVSPRSPGQRRAQAPSQARTMWVPARKPVHARDPPTQGRPVPGRAHSAGRRRVRRDRYCSSTRCPPVQGSVLRVTLTGLGGAPLRRDPPTRWAVPRLLARYPAGSGAVRTSP